MTNYSKDLQTRDFRTSPDKVNATPVTKEMVRARIDRRRALMTAMAAQCFIGLLVIQFLG
ncbi:MAG: hypothetical protein WBC93_18495 [Sulfitobacter sp.]